MAARIGKQAGDDFDAGGLARGDSGAAFSAALEVLPFSNRRLRVAQTPLEFAEQAVESTAAVYVDWKLTPEAVVDMLANRVAPEVYADWETAGDALVIWTEASEGGRLSERRVDGYRTRPREEIVSAFAEVLPVGVRICALWPFKAARTDFDGYLVLTAELEQQLRSALGALWPTVLVALPLGRPVGTDGDAACSTK